MPFNLGAPELIFVLTIIGIVALVWFFLRQATSPSRGGKTQCAQCGEFVYRQAKFCRFCGASFTPSARA
jgi:uncharacterized OB-fold protein